MNERLTDLTPDLDLVAAPGAGPVRLRRPVYRKLLPPCNAACPAGENIQAWLAHVAAGRHRAAWETLVRDNPLPAAQGRVCYHPCESACNRAELESAVSGGYWPLFRFNPVMRTVGARPFRLDSLRPTIPFEDYAYRELRYRTLTETDPQAAAALLAQARHVVAERYRLYEELATRGGESFHPAPSAPLQAAKDHGHS